MSFLTGTMELEKVLLTGAIAMASSVLVSILSQYLLKRRFRRELFEKYYGKLYEEKLAAYREFWGVLEAVSPYTPEGDGVFRQAEGKNYLHRERARRFFLDLRTFFYSRDGIFLSQDLRITIYRTRQLVEQELSAGDGEAQEVVLSNTRMKRIVRGFNYMRSRARSDVGLEDLPDKPFDEDEP